LYDSHQPRRGLAGPGNKGQEEVAIKNGTRTFSAYTATNSLVSDPTLPILETEGLQLGVERNNLFDPTQVTGYSSSQDLPLSQYSWIEDVAGNGNINYNGIHSENSLSPAAAAMTPSANGESSMSLLHNPSNNSVISDIEFQFEEYNYGSGIELQLATFSQASPATTLANSSSAFSLPSMPTTISTNKLPLASPLPDPLLPCHFAKNKLQTSKSLVFSNMIISMIHAYPLMMTRRETFPPFIHAYFPSSPNHNPSNSSVSQSQLHPHLASCMGIAQLFSACNSDTRLFVWGTIRSEMRKLREQTSTFDKFDALSAFQASLMYLIMRAVMGDRLGIEQEATHDYEILMAYEVRYVLVFSFDFHFLKDM
jgi:hypothetical protein